MDDGPITKENFHGSTPLNRWVGPRALLFQVEGSVAQNLEATGRSQGLEEKYWDGRRRQRQRQRQQQQQQQQQSYTFP